MWLNFRTLLCLFFALATASSFGGDDKFLKKYAMMKIYESCFGPDVIRQVRAEMKAACAKCSMVSLSEPHSVPHQGFQSQGPSIPNPSNPGIPSQLQSFLSNQNKNPDAIVGPLPHPPAIEDAFKFAKPGSGEVNQPPQIQPNIDLNQLNQAILSFRQNQLLQAQAQQPLHRHPYPGPGPVPLYGPWGNPLYPGGWNGPIVSPYSGYGGPSPGGPLPPFYPQFYPNDRVSRDIDFQDRMELFAAKTQANATPHNITCVMQELGYLDRNLEPSVERIAQRISGLPVSNDLKEDMLEGLEYCQKFSQCVPETKQEKLPLSRELIKPMFFFRCYKHKKLEACVMKDVRERFNTEDAIDNNLEEMRAQHGRSMRHPQDSTADMLFDFLYGNQDMELDSYL